MIQAWAEGKDIEICLRKVQVEADQSIANGRDEISAFGSPGGQEQCLIGSGRWLRVKNGITMDSGSSVFVVPSGWLRMFPVTESEGSRRGQTHTAAAKSGKPIVNEGQ